MGYGKTSIICQIMRFMSGNPYTPNPIPYTQTNKSAFTIFTSVAFVTAVLGVSLFLLLTFILSLLSRINLLERQIVSIENMIGESEGKLQEVANLIRQSASEAKKVK